MDLISASFDFITTNGNHVRIQFQDICSRGYGSLNYEIFWNNSETPIHKNKLHTRQVNKTKAEQLVKMFLRRNQNLDVFNATTL